MLQKTYKIVTEMEYKALNKLQIINESLFDYLIEELEDVSSDDEPNPGEGQEDQENPQPPQQPPQGKEGQQPPQQGGNPPQGEEGQPPPPTPEQQLMMELDATQEKLVQFNIHGKLNDLKKNLEFAIDNISSNNISNKDIIEKLNYYDDLLDVLSKLIYVLSPNTIYMLYGTTQLEITELLKEYLALQKNTQYN